MARKVVAYTFSLEPMAEVLAAWILRQHSVGTVVTGEIPGGADVGIGGGVISERDPRRNGRTHGPRKPRVASHSKACVKS